MAGPGLLPGGTAAVAALTGVLFLCLTLFGAVPHDHASAGEAADCPRCHAAAHHPAALPPKIVVAVPVFSPVPVIASTVPGAASAIRFWIPPLRAPPAISRLQR